MTFVPFIIALGLTIASTPQTPAVDSDGFIRQWLVLAPIAIDTGMAPSELDRDLINGEVGLRPIAGQKVSLLGFEWTWQPHTATDYFIDFRTSFGQQGSDDMAAYAVAYVEADADMAVKLAVGSNDEFKAWLNGQPIMKFDSARGLEKDSDVRDVMLRQGQNVLVLKVINETNNWQACARFLRDGQPVTNLKISLAPR